MHFVFLVLLTPPISEYDIADLITQVFDKSKHPIAYVTIASAFLSNLEYVATLYPLSTQKFLSWTAQRELVNPDICHCQSLVLYLELA
ncbi:hypothetical protein BDA96_08G018100 [Sorghum bicolor]|uniref:Uncharacterized protein n=2 Tax=Sorghum bicolor TaxID=4558 RepID=A0A921U6R3_SORBI|nr:hypothetical protein BDA96_08G018100 [Sorghum bicolor]KXG22850.1 hypothetical protein SORBI_3008G016400 [Sorghum bicolor]